MGTNYFLDTDVCPTCNCSKGRLHIGKSSAGWCFSLHVDPEEGIRELADWQKLWSQPNSRIVDEYSREVTPDQMMLTITSRSWGRSPEPGELVMNDALLGPNNLMRRRVGPRTLGHGEGTYDLVLGEFS